MMGVKKCLKKWAIITAIVCVVLTLLIMILILLAMLSMDDAIIEYTERTTVPTAAVTVSTTLEIKQEVDNYTCIQNLCLNNGSCWQKTNETYICACPHGFFGHNCQHDYSFMCSDYYWMNETDLNENEVGSVIRCEYNKGAWYRFGGYGGNRVSTTCQFAGHCAAHYPGWMEGSHPEVSDAVVKRTVYFNGIRGCKTRKEEIKVLNCISYYIYYVQAVVDCSKRICASFDPV